MMVTDWFSDVVVMFRAGSVYINTVVIIFILFYFVLICCRSLMVRANA